MGQKDRALMNQPNPFVHREVYFVILCIIATPAAFTENAMKTWYFPP
jgi:hypothetical protein